MQRNPYRIGEGEKLFAELLAERGIATESQKPVGKYNLDLACFPVAVEIHSTPAHPLTLERNRKRMMYLRKRGWRVLFIWLNTRLGDVILPRDADEAVRFIKCARTLPPMYRKHWVIRCRS